MNKLSDLANLYSSSNKKVSAKLYSALEQLQLDLKSIQLKNENIPHALKSNWQPLEQVAPVEPAFRKSVLDELMTGNYSPSETEVYVKKMYSPLIDKVNKAIKSNESARAHNQKIADGVFDLMKSLGIQKHKTTYAYKTARSKNKTETIKESSISERISQLMPKSNDKLVLSVIERDIDHILRYEASAIREAYLDRKAKTNEEVQSKKNEILLRISSDLMKLKESKDQGVDLVGIINGAKSVTELDTIVQDYKL